MATTDVRILDISYILPSFLHMRSLKAADGLIIGLEVFSYFHGLDEMEKGPMFN